MIYRRVGIGAPNFINHFKTYYNKRARAANCRARVPAAVSALRKLRFLDRKQDGKFMTIDFEARDQANAITAVQIYVNDVPRLPRAGKTRVGKQAANERARRDDFRKQ